LSVEDDVARWLLVLPFVALAFLGMRDAGAAARRGAARSLRLDTFFRATAAPERLTIPLARIGGVVTRRQYSGYVLVEAKGAGQSGPRDVDPIWTWRDEAQVGSSAEEYGLCLGLNGTTALPRGSGHAITRWIVFVDREGWKNPLGSFDDVAPDYSTSHGYRFAIYLGPYPRTLALGVGLDKPDTQYGSTGDFQVTLTPAALRPAVQPPETSRSWEPLDPALLSLRGTRLLGPRNLNFGRVLPDPPALRRKDDTYEVAFPGTDLPPVQPHAPSEPFRVSRPSVHLPGWPVFHLRERATPSVFDGPSVNPLVQPDGAGPLSFTGLASSLLRPAERIVGLDSNSYYVVGFAVSHGAAYVGVCWFDGASSAQLQTHGVVFRLTWDGRRLGAEPVRRIDVGGGSRFWKHNGPPLLDSLPGGDLLLVEAGASWRLSRDRKWRRISEPAPNGALWLRGRWLVVGRWESYNAAVGYPVHICRDDTRVIVLDALSRERVREFRWSRLEYVDPERKQN
jgi:hypothetical protein